MTKLIIFLVISILYVFKKAFSIYNEDCEVFPYILPTIFLGIIPNLILVGIAYLIFF